jgi:hypothetical protein
MQIFEIMGFPAELEGKWANILAVGSICSTFGSTSTTIPRKLCLQWFW